jgi:hypothetical protein
MIAMAREGTGRWRSLKRGETERREMRRWEKVRRDDEDGMRRIGNDG